MQGWGSQVTDRGRLKKLGDMNPKGKHSTMKGKGQSIKTRTNLTYAK
jgi:hypothetical protein